ncbi:uncharacterized protein OCT59_012541 [Rhizophagus irregularis]|uniref:uncharacterized protein n=1 Tax=Rhizophagus irregularis TaxID=588596 RepID=UPI003331CB9A|nr:hypothetical protein OCT59_012541 [Rhizophagus irregularis]
MSDNSVIEINDIDKIDKIDVDKIDVDKIDFDKIDVDENDVDKIFTFDDIDDERHNSKSIIMIEISPSENYLITYSKEDRSIIGWNVKNIDKVQLKFHQTVKIDEKDKCEIKSLCVSDDKKLAYIIRYYNNGYNAITLIDMNNKDKKITLNLDTEDAYYCAFNLKSEFILYSVKDDISEDDHKIIWIYSTQTKNNKWECKRFYMIPEDYELISISKYDKVYLYSDENDYIYEWNINTEKSVKIFVNNKNRTYKFKTKNIGIFSNEELIFLKIQYKIIIVYSIELGIPIASLDINDDIQLYNFMNHTDLFLLPSVFYYTPDKEIKYCWNSKYKNVFNQTLFDKSTYKLTYVTFGTDPIYVLTDEQTKFVLGILNGRVWKSKFEEKMSTNFSPENSNELNKENNKIIKFGDHDKINKKTYKHLNVYSFNLYMGTVFTLFQKAIRNNGDSEVKKSAELTGNLIKWDVHVDNEKIKLEVFRRINTEWESISTRIENHPYKFKDYYCILIASSLFNNDDIVILTNFGILIYTFNENNKSSDNNKSSEKDKSIFLNYFYYMNLENYRYKNSINNHDIIRYKDCMKSLQIFLKSTLPLPNYNSFRLNGWNSDVINNKTSLLKYGVGLLTFAIKEHNLELIDDNYKKCMTYFKEDLINNKSFLSIITSTMPLLDKYYPEYILKYSSETNMIIDSPFYSIKHRNKNLHLYSFSQYPQLANLSKSLLWTKFHRKLKLLSVTTSIIWLIICVTQALIILLTLPLYFVTFYILSKYNFINNIYASDAFSYVYFLAN